MGISYYPGCTLKLKAKNLEDSAMAAAAALDAEMQELPRWNCCGAVFSLADDNLLMHVAPVRDLIRVKEQGNDKVVTLCSMCYNTLARANNLVREDEEKRDTINRFMDEEPDYTGDVEVVHFLTWLRDDVGWDKVKAAVKKPLDGLKVAPYYGCTLTRPYDVAIDDQPENPAIMREFIEALGAECVEYTEQQTCCGSYQVLASPETALHDANKILGSAQGAGADVLALSCPLCEYNVGAQQRKLQENDPESPKVPTLYFTQLLAIALGLDEDALNLDLNQDAARELLKNKNYMAVSP